MSVQGASLNINRYQIINKIGEGSFSQVYRVKDLIDKEFYAAKILNYMIDEDIMDSQEMLLLFREVNLMSVFDHPSILKFIGYYQTNFSGESTPTIISELAMNGSLKDVIEMEMSGFAPDFWDDTKKLINIYGIASGMSYLHSNNVLHRDLKPVNILMDEFLHPKISDFVLAKMNDFLSISMNIQSAKGMKGTPIYMAPEIFSEENYSKSSDVYAFGFIVFEIMTGEMPFKGFSLFQIIKKVKDEGFRPKIKEDVPNSYRELIERCWSQKPEDRPSFQTIVEELKSNEAFITELTDKSEFEDYVEFIDNSINSFDFYNRRIRYNDFIKVYGKNKKLNTFTFNKSDIKNESKYIKHETNLELVDDKNTSDMNFYSKNTQSIIKPEQIENKISPFMKLNETTQENTQLIITPEIIESNYQSLIKANETAQENTQSFIKSEQIENKIPPFMKFNETTQENIQLTTTPEHTENSLPPFSKFNQTTQENTQLIITPNAIEDAYKSYLKYEDDNIENNVEQKFSSIPLHSFQKFYSLNKKCQDLVKESLNDAQKQFIVGKSLIEAENDFPKDLELGLEYIKKSFEQKYIKAIIYYISLLIKGNIIPQDIDKANEYISEIYATQYDYYFLIMGSIYKKIKKYSDAAQCFLNGIKMGNTECMYKYGKMEFLGKGINRNSTEALSIIFQSKRKGNKKSEYFITIFTKFNAIKNFSKNPAETVIFLVTNNIKSIMKNNEQQNNYGFDNLVIQPHITEMLYFNKSLKNTAFHKCLEKYQNVSIEIKYPSKSFKSVIDLVNKLKTKVIKNLKIGIVFDSMFMEKISKKCFINVSYHKINSDINIIPTDTFKECAALNEITIPSSVTEIRKSSFYKCYGLKTVNLPSSIIRLRSNIFSNCSYLTKIEIPHSVKIIGKWAFFLCSSLKEIEIPSSVQIIKHGAFCRCSSLEKITIENITIRYFAYCIFSDCSSIVQINIPSSVTIIGQEAFKNCSSLENVLFKNDSHLFAIENEAFLNCSSLKSISIPLGVKKVGFHIFTGCNSLEEITLSVNLKKFDYLYLGRKAIFI